MKTWTSRIPSEQRAHLARASAACGLTSAAYLRRLIACDMAGASAQETVAEVATRDEALALLTRRAREGSIQAARALLATQELQPAGGARSTPEPSADVFDELAPRRTRTG